MGDFFNKSVPGTVYDVFPVFVIIKENLLLFI